MNKLTPLTVALVLALAGGNALADNGDNSMSQWYGNSYRYFEDARLQGEVKVKVAEPKQESVRPTAQPAEKPRLLSRSEMRGRRTTPSPFNDNGG
jgi:hypothetical protein